MTAIHLYNNWFEKLRHMRADEHKARLRTIAWTMVGMILSHLALKIPGVAQATSVVKSTSRLLRNGECGNGIARWRQRC
jgi:hypothetical protein